MKHCIKNLRFFVVITAVIILLLLFSGSYSLRFTGAESCLWKAVNNGQKQVKGNVVSTLSCVFVIFFILFLNTFWVNTLFSFKVQ